MSSNFIPDAKLGEKPEFKQDFSAKYRVAEKMSALVRRVLCENPSPYTYTGTGTYIIGNATDAVVIDPGPNMASHGEALLNAIGDKCLKFILVTHTHQDHSPLSGWLKEQTGATVYGFGPHGTGRRGVLVGEEVEAGADKKFTPDEILRDGDTVSGDGWTIKAIHTPGHTANHLCFLLEEENILFVGDHIMGWATTVISPPDGDMKDYIESLKKVAALEPKALAPTHGPWVDKPKPFIRGIITHRKMREGQILDHLKSGCDTIDELVASMYKNVDKRLHPAAARSVLAHLIAMTDDGRVNCESETTLNARYRAA